MRTMNLIVGLFGAVGVVCFFFFATWLMNLVADHCGPLMGLAVGTLCIGLNVVNGLVAGENLGKALFGSKDEQ